MLSEIKGLFMINLCMVPGENEFPHDAEEQEIQNSTLLWMKILSFEQTTTTF